MYVSHCILHDFAFPSCDKKLLPRIFNVLKMVICTAVSTMCGKNKKIRKDKIRYFISN